MTTPTPVSIVLPVVLVALLLLAATAAPGPAPAQGAVDASRATVKPSHPDVIVIMTDDQRAGTEQGMPYLWDRLRPEMTHYPNAQVPNNNCCPARTSFLTGRHSHTTGVWDNTWAAPGAGPSGGWRQFHRSGYERRTLPVALRRQGYQTVLLGKYVNQYHHRDPDEGEPVPPGWSDFRTYLHSDGQYWLTAKNPIVGVPVGYTADVLGDVAAQVIAATPKTQPLFLVYSPMAPHVAPRQRDIAGPYRGAAARSGALARMRAAGRWTNPSVGEVDRSDKPIWNQRLPPLRRDGGPGSPFPDVREATTEHADTLMGVDANIRKIVEQQRSSRNWDNTVVVFMSDNGVAWGDHVLFGKTTPYRLTNEIPLLVKYPTMPEWNPRTDRRLMNQLDVTATIAELTSVRLRTQGRSALQPPARSGLVLESTTSKKNYAYWHRSYCAWRTKSALYVRYGNGFEELYDYATDPYELTNQARSRHYRVLRNRMMVATALACSPRPPGYRRPRPDVKVKGTRHRTQLLVDVNPDLIKGRQWQLTVQIKSGRNWERVGKPVATRGRLRTRVFDLDKGTYRVRVAADHGFAAVRSRTARLRA